jgi:hypothetical protein
MTTLYLIILDSVSHSLLFEISGNYFNNMSLHRVPLGNETIRYRIPLYTSQLTSTPAILYTLNGWVLLVSDNDTFRVVNTSSPEAINEPVQRGDVLRIPNMSIYSEGTNIPEDLQRMQLPPFNDDLLSQIGRVIAEHLPLSTILNGQSPESLSLDDLFRQSYATFLKQLYGIPVQLPEYLIINGLRANFVPFQQITQMLSQNQIERFVLDPLLQPWAGPPVTTNRILTMFGKNGITYLVKAQYDPKQNQIFSPI